MACNPDKLQTLIENSGLSYRQNSVSYIFDCPKCLKKQKLYIRKRDGAFICWFCAEIDGYRGRPEYALADLTQTPVKIVQEALYGALAASDEDYFDIQLPDWFGDDDDVDEEAVVLETLRYPWDYVPIDHPYATKARAYLEGRGIPIALAKEYDLYYAPKDRRVIFPVKVSDRLVGWQARAIYANRVWNEDKQNYVESSKMLSSRGIPTAHTVMFSDRLRGSKHAVVGEGPFDAMKMHLAGGNIATMGKAVSKGQIEAIRNPERLTRQQIGQLRFAGIERVYLALDPDAARETARLVREFSDLEVYTVSPPAGVKDLGAMSLDDAYSAFQDARRVSTANVFVYFDWK
jgi:hypothetical protein